MPWSGQKEFEAAPIVPFVVDGVEAGKLQSHGPLAFLKVWKSYLSLFLCITYVSHCVET